MTPSDVSRRCLRGLNTDVMMMMMMMMMMSTERPGAQSCTTGSVSNLIRREAEYSGFRMRRVFGRPGCCELHPTPPRNSQTGGMEFGRSVMRLVFTLPP
ncbi:hypothetical protein Z043_106376 [Scleropages formosus]|uniref:Uncharacterized protein n=1 Tax=Scleropages formosus TaxID=113540 RepID=A0A0P7UWL8_SCLFO|nr:hypothetical protein Z043_106376 [Scleropages formosus]